MYNLDNFDFIYVAESDSKVVLGWSATALVISFKGTSSMTNVRTDIKAWSTPFLSSQAGRTGMKVHIGFYEAWRCGGLNTQVLEKAHKVITSAETIDDMRVLVTGHSLGGALATLAAVEIKERDLAVNVTAYTFGAPRVGNKHFTAYSNALVPNAFAIINKEDPVPRIPKLGYKRTGQRVNMSLLTGDLVVNPTYFEVSVYSSTAGSRKEHATGSYGLALALFIKSQFFISKRLPGGGRGRIAVGRSGQPGHGAHRVQHERGCIN